MRIFILLIYSTQYKDKKDYLLTSKSNSRKNSPEHVAIRPWSALGFRDYRILWISSVAAMMTMGLRITATGVWLYEETGSGADLAWLGIIELVMRIPANLYGGALADEVDRKKLMSFTQAVSFLLIGTIMVLEGFDTLEIWHIYTVTAVLSASSVMGGPARSSMTARVVPRSYLMHAVATNTATMQIGTMITPLIFWLTSLTPDLTVTFALTTVMAGISVVLPLFIINDEIKEGRLVKILENHNIESETLYVIRLSRRFTPAKVRAMIDYLKTKFTDLNKLN